MQSFDEFMNPPTRWGRIKKNYGFLATPILAVALPTVGYFGLLTTEEKYNDVVIVSNEISCEKIRAFYQHLPTDTITFCRDIVHLRHDKMDDIVEEKYAMLERELYIDYADLEPGKHYDLVVRRNRFTNEIGIWSATPHQDQVSVPLQKPAL